MDASAAADLRTKDKRQKPCSDFGGRGSKGSFEETRDLKKLRVANNWICASKLCSIKFQIDEVIKSPIPEGIKFV